MYQFINYMDVVFIMRCPKEKKRKVTLVMNCDDIMCKLCSERNNSLHLPPAGGLKSL